MKKPIIINTKLSFILAAPILAKDGILITNENTPVTFVGAANEIYRGAINKEKNEDEIYAFEVGSRSYSYLWTKEYLIGGRNNRLLFCVNGSVPGDFENNQKIKRDFNLYLNIFIQNANKELGDYMQIKANHETEFSYEATKNAILWQMAQLLTISEHFFIPNEI